MDPSSLETDIAALHRLDKGRYTEIEREFLRTLLVAIRKYLAVVARLR
jgi:hypothetical protein